MVKVKQSETIENSQYASKPGRYHVTVTQFIENPPDKNDIPMEGAVKLGVEILAGTDSSEAKKTFNTTFFAPKESDSGKQDFNTLKLTRLIVALTGLHRPGEETELTEADAIGRQMVIELAHRTDKNDTNKVYFDLKGANLFHVDDPEVANVPKDQEWINLIAPELRKKPVTDLVGAGASASAAPAASGGVSLDDI